jgi:hypothetical protein
MLMRVGLCRNDDIGPITEQCRAHVLEFGPTAHSEVRQNPSEVPSYIVETKVRLGCLCGCDVEGCGNLREQCMEPSQQEAK